MTSIPEASTEIRAWASTIRSTREAAPVTVTSSSSTAGSPTSSPLGTGPMTALTGTTRLTTTSNSTTIRWGSQSRTVTRGSIASTSTSTDFRRSAGPFAVRTAVQTEVTAPAIADILGELRRIREAPIEAQELRDARDFLVGVFPLRFEAAAQVVGAITGLVVHGLPDDELDRYRQAVAALTEEEVHAAALAHVHPDAFSIVMVGDAERVVPALETMGLGPPEIVRETVPTAVEEA